MRPDSRRFVLDGEISSVNDRGVVTHTLQGGRGTPSLLGDGQVMAEIPGGPEQILERPARSARCFGQPWIRA